MKFIIKLDFNQKGIDLTNKKIYNIPIELEYIPDDEEIKKIIKEKVPNELWDKYELIKGGFVNLEVGDFVKLIEINSPYSSITRLEKVKEIKDTIIIIENYMYPFNYEGKEHSRRKKNLSHIEIPTKKEIEGHKEWLRHEELYNKIIEFIEDEKLGTLSNSQLEGILNIMLGK